MPTLLVILLSISFSGLLMSSVVMLLWKKHYRRTETSVVELTRLISLTFSVIFSLVTLFFFLDQSSDARGVRKVEKLYGLKVIKAPTDLRQMAAWQFSDGTRLCYVDDDANPIQLYCAATESLPLASDN